MEIVVRANKAIGRVRQILWFISRSIRLRGSIIFSIYLM